MGFDDDPMICPVCEAYYPVVREVPVFRPDRDELDAKNWFEEMFVGRSRDDDLATEYLRPERDFLPRFAFERKLVGPSLEVGCGTGILAETLPGYVGLEYPLGSLLVPGFEKFDRICADARWLPFPDATFECAFSISVLEHVPQVELAFAELDRVLKPGGYLLLHPAWHCQRYTTELIQVKPYSDLTLRQKLVKLCLPIIRSKPYKMATWFPKRAWRHLIGRDEGQFRYEKFTPYHGAEWVPDSDAVAGIDCFESIRYYIDKGYSCLSHPSLLRQIRAGHDMIVVQKPY